jgi:hypothetical protein
VQLVAAKTVVSGIVMMCELLRWSTMPTPVSAIRCYDDGVEWHCDDVGFASFAMMPTPRHPQSKHRSFL